MKVTLAAQMPFRSKNTTEIAEFPYAKAHPRPAPKLGSASAMFGTAAVEVKNSCSFERLTDMSKIMQSSGNELSLHR